MVNGPPTPPPTTATELQDEARENPSTVEASTSLPQNRPEDYQHVLASIAEAISKGDYSRVTNIAQEADYEVSSFLSLSFYSLIHMRS
jgi:COP9 signalosome complex subunit 8